MTKSTASVKGKGPELFGRGIDLLFGADENVSARAAAFLSPAQGDEESLESGSRGSISASPAWSGGSRTPSLENSALDAPTYTELDVDQFLRMAAEAFLRVQAQRTRSMAVGQPGRSTTIWQAPASASEFDADPELAGIDLAVPPLPAEMAEPVSVAPTGPSLDSAPEAVAGANLEMPTLLDDSGAAIDLDLPPLPQEQPATDQPAISEPDTAHVQAPPVATGTVAGPEENEMTDQPIAADVASQPVASENGQPRKVAPPGVTVSGPVIGAGGSKADAEDEALSQNLVDREAPAMSRKEIEEILDRLPKSDLRALDKEIDKLYEDVTKYFSGHRREITVAFEILRKARVILLKDPEQFAEAEFLVRQVQARVHQVRQSIEQGSRFWPRLLAYQTVWLVLMAVVALITTVNGASFSGWLALMLGVPVASETLGWAVLFISTLAWGGIGGATSALWSLYYHISIQRDYEPIENLWYYTQPLIGMVLGGIVFLIMGSGFLVIQADPTEGGMGARLIPAVIAVVAGFRQTVVLDLIERLVGLITPTGNEPDAEASTEELTI